jgi:hypothetical protein
MMANTAGSSRVLYCGNRQTEQPGLRAWFCVFDEQRAGVGHGGEFCRGQGALYAVQSAGGRFPFDCLVGQR